MAWPVAGRDDVGSANAACPMRDIPMQNITMREVPLRDVPMRDLPLRDVPMQDVPLPACRVCAMPHLVG